MFLEAATCVYCKNYVGFYGSATVICWGCKRQNEVSNKAYGYNVQRMLGTIEYKRAKRSNAQQIGKSKRNTINMSVGLNFIEILGTQFYNNKRYVLFLPTIL